MKTVSRAYDSYVDARAAVKALEEAGVPAQDISLVANKCISPELDEADAYPDAATGIGLGTALGGGAGLLAGLGILTIPGLGPVVAAGWLASIAVGAMAGAAGVEGKMVSLIVGEVRQTSTRLSISFMFAKRQSTLPANWLSLASRSACAQVTVLAVPVQVLPVQV